MSWFELIKRSQAGQDGPNLIDLNAQIDQWNLRVGSLPKMPEILAALEPGRAILGGILKRLNTIAAVLKDGIRRPSQKTIALAKEMYPEFQYLIFTQQASQHSEKLLSGISKYIQQNPGTDYSQQTFVSILLSMAHTISHSSFDSDDLAMLKTIAEGSINTAPTAYEDEVEASRVAQFLKQSIYSVKDPAQRTLRVVREVLQNSADAIMQNQHINPTNKAEIRIDTHVHHDSQGSSMDLRVTDTGVGMNWDTVAKKFFVYFASGKENTEDAGGFGIAKAYIQEVPEEGWSLDTNSLHTSKFQKSRYFSKQRSENYQPPTSRVQPLPNGGTVITLYNIPAADDYGFRSLAEKYSTNGILKIFINGEDISPKFLLSELRPIDPRLSAITEEVGTSEMEKLIIQNTIFMTTKDGGSASNIGDLKWEVDNRITTAKFFIKSKHNQSGSMYVFLNGQYQFDSGYIPKADLICMIQTNSRPGDDSYPVDPGRENLRAPYLEQTKAIFDQLKDLLTKISENELFKQGLNVHMFNTDMDPMNTVDKEDDPWRRDQEEISESKKKNTRDAIESAWYSVTQSGLFGGGEKTEKDKRQEFIEAVEETIRNKPLDSGQKAIVNSAISNILDTEDKEKFDIEEAMNMVVDGLTTPGVVAVQKDFVSPELARDRLDLTGSTLLLWQRVLNIIMNRIKPRAKRQSSRNKSFMPGLIYSNEALALYMPPQKESVGSKTSNTYMIMVNPITVSSIVDPKYFTQQLEMDTNRDSNAFGEEEVAVHEIKDETPINKLAAFMFHTAIHELTHLMFPDSYGHETFHAQISKIESICHFDFPAVRNEVKKFMRPIKRDSRKLITAIKKEKMKH